ncbi:MAG: exodeoxyribonuclease-3 [Myxococcota bacterium]|jgi:exodeoxyribonuclease-3
MTKIKIVSWNVNSVNARLENLLFYLNETKPDVVLLQEIKCEDEKFPKDAIANLGYNIEIFGQKSYNGVAILSKFPVNDVIKNLDAEDFESRYIEGFIEVKDSSYLGIGSDCEAGIVAKTVVPNEQGVGDSKTMGVHKIRIASIYVPNGGAKLEDGQKVNETARFAYKMRFFDDLKIRMQKIFRSGEIAVFGGDYNVAIENVDVFDEKVLKDTVCFHVDEKIKFRELLNLGFQDSFRMKNPHTQNFSWWDYRGNCWGYNKGMRIDYLLTSPKASDIIESASMDDSMMMEREKPSDHCPVVVTLDLK